MPAWISVSISTGRLGETSTVQLPMSEPGNLHEEEKKKRRREKEGRRSG